MVVLKINADTPQEREVKIVNDKGTWSSGSYHIYTAASLQDIQTEERMMLMARITWANC